MREGQEVGGWGQRGRWRRSSGCRMGSAADITLPPGLRRLGDGVLGSPGNSAAESGVLPGSRSSSTPKSHQG